MAALVAAAMEEVVMARASTVPVEAAAAGLGSEEEEVESRVAVMVQVPREQVVEEATVQARWVKAVVWVAGRVAIKVEERDRAAQAMEVAVD